MFMNKKGVSPIIAAVLLVVITIAIGATTMAFIRSLSDQNLASAQEKSSKISCGTDVQTQILAIGNNYKVCKTNASNYFEVTLKSTGTKEIKKYKLTVLGNGDPGFTSNETAEINFMPNTIRKINLTYDGTETGEPIDFQLEPIIQGNPGQDVYCSDSLMIWKATDISEC